MLANPFGSSLACRGDQRRKSALIAEINARGGEGFSTIAQSRHSRRAGS